MRKLIRVNCTRGQMCGGRVSVSISHFAAFATRISLATVLNVFRMYDITLSIILVRNHLDHICLDHLTFMQTPAQSFMGMHAHSHSAVHLSSMYYLIII